MTQHQKKPTWEERVELDSNEYRVWLNRSQLPDVVIGAKSPEQAAEQCLNGLDSDWIDEQIHAKVEDSDGNFQEFDCSIYLAWHISPNSPN